MNRLKRSVFDAFYPWVSLNSYDRFVDLCEPYHALLLKNYSLCCSQKKDNKLHQLILAGNEEEAKKIIAKGNGNYSVVK